MTVLAIQDSPTEHQLWFDCHCSFTVVGHVAVVIWTTTLADMIMMFAYKVDLLADSQDMTDGSDVRSNHHVRTLFSSSLLQKMNKAAAGVVQLHIYLGLAYINRQTNGAI